MRSWEITALSESEFYDAISSPLSGLQGDTIAALMELFQRVRDLERLVNNEP